VLTSTAPLLKEVSGESLPLIASTRYIYKATYAKEIMTLVISVKKFVSLDGEVKSYIRFEVLTAVKMSMSVF
jgi:hypothetical protein